MSSTGSPAARSAPRSLPRLAPALAIVAACAAWTTPFASAQEPATLPPADRPVTPSTTPVFRLGASLDAPSWQQFGEIPQVAFGPEGTLHILDEQRRGVVVVDGSGSLVRYDGRPGRGPGEFVFPGAITVLADGRSVVWEGGRDALVVFGREGKLQREVRLRGLSREVNPDEVILRVGDTGVAWLPSGVPVSLEARARGEVGRATLWRLDVDAGGPQEVTAVPRRAAAVTRTDGTVQRVEPPVFSPSTHWAPLPSGGWVVAHDPGYVLRILDEAGAEVRRIVRTVDRIPVTERHREAWIAEFTRDVRNAPTMSVGATGAGGGDRTGPDIEALIEQELSTTTFAEHFPAIAGLTVDREGVIWIQRGEAWPGRDGLIDLVRPDGTYLGTLPRGRIPDAFGPGGLAAWIVEDELGVQGVEVRRVVLP